MLYFKENYTFPRFQRGPPLIPWKRIVQHFPRGGGGSNFFQGCSVFSRGWGGSAHEREGSTGLNMWGVLVVQSEQLDVRRWLGREEIDRE